MSRGMLVASRLPKSPNPNPNRFGWIRQIAGEHTLLLSGDIHYSRALPSDQARALAMLKADGLNTVQACLRARLPALTASSTV